MITISGFGARAGPTAPTKGRRCWIEVTSRCSRFDALANEHAAGDRDDQHAILGHVASRGDRFSPQRE
jgi:hypothetical protein